MISPIEAVGIYDIIYPSKREMEMNKFTKHSSGPWAIHPERPFEIVMDDDDVCPLVATVNADQGSVDQDQARADARLISAAPDMLAALSRIANAVEINSADMSAVLAAISKAEGR